MGKYKVIFSAVILCLVLLSSPALFAQCPDIGDLDDTGARDTLFVRSSLCNTVFVAGYHDEALSGFAIRLFYKNPQQDVFLDSVVFHPDISGRREALLHAIASSDRRGRPRIARGEGPGRQHQMNRT